MFYRFAIVAAALLAALLSFATTRPDTIQVRRGINIKAPAARILPMIADFHCWSLWSPYEKRDAGMKRVFDGAASGRGAIYEWEGNLKVGKGRMEILQASPSKVVIKLDFAKPIEGHNIAAFNLVERGPYTHVAWSVSGRNGYMGKLISVFFDMDRLIGPDFEAGLANLKSAVERDSPWPPEHSNKDGERANGYGTEASL